MQYLLLFVAILVVIVLVNLLMFVLIRALGRQVSDQAGACLLSGLEFSDEVYEEKSEKLESLREEESRIRGRTTAGSLGGQLDAAIISRQTEPAVQAAGTEDRKEETVRPMGNPVNAGYINRELVAQYRYIKEHFDIDAKKAVEHVLADRQGESYADYGEECRRMYDLLDDETVFRLLILPFEEQIRELCGIFDRTQQEIAAALFERDDRMDVVLLRDTLANEARLYRDDITVLAADAAALDGLSDADGITVTEDDTLCEGVKIFRGSKMYDYSF
ncbi:MAG: hypothetical protein LUC32_06450 [Clostridiales bacterium]|nr:hypothetical protein [Clostridiales bacterium]